MAPHVYHVDGDVILDKVEDGAAHLTQVSQATLQADAENERRNTVMQSQWDRAMCREFKIPDKYQSVACLIVRWDDELDKDLNCRAEVEELDSLLKDRFHFESTVCVLNVKQKPQLQLNSAINDLVFKYNGPWRTHLLIVYYTGHGFGRDTNELMLYGTRRADNEPKDGDYEPEASWNRAETSLDDADADVLTILDCCFASRILMKDITENSRSHEVLAASGRDGLTQGPGKKSFTRAMIDCLHEELAGEAPEPFTVSYLNEMIMKRRTDTRSHVFNRHAKRRARQIYLAPLSASKVENVTGHKSDAAHLTLRIALKDSTRLEEFQIRDLATELSKGCKRSGLKIRAIDWMDFRPSKDVARNQRLARMMRAMRVISTWWVATKSHKSESKRKAEEDSLEDAPETKRQTRSRTSLTATQSQPLTPRSQSPGL